MPVLGYFRVSDDRQVDGYSLDAQERAYTAWVAQNQHEDIGRLRDEGRSAFRNSLERPDFQRALHLVRSKQVDAVWVHRSSRFSRDDSVSDDLLDQFERLGVKLVVDHTTIDRSTPHGWLGHKVNSIFDEAYSRFVSFEVKKGLRKKAEQGRWVGPLPLGYAKMPTGT